MSIQASPLQTASINGLPVNHCFVFSYVMTREMSDTAPWILEVKFVMAAYDSTIKKYFPVMPIRTVMVKDIEMLAMMEAAKGKLDLAMSMGPFQVGLAHVIASQCSDLSTAQHVEMP